MRSDFLPLSRPSISEEDIAAVSEVLRSGWITSGAKNIEFEQKFCEYVGCSGAVTLSSATAGMHLVLKKLGIGPGDEVITPSMTWVSTVNLIVLSGATPVFTDIDKDTLMVSRDLIEERLTDKTRLIIPVHFAGAPVHIDQIRDLAAEKNVFIVEDAAHSLGAEYMGDRIGKEGTSIFSFHPIKNITTGEGGMFCSNDRSLLEHIRRLKFHGLSADAYDRQKQNKLLQTQVLEPGYKYNMTDISAALGLQQLANVDKFNRKRTELALRYRERLSEVDEILPLSIPPYNIKHAWHLFVVRIDIDKAGLSREDFMHAMKQRKIGTGIHFLPVHLHKYYMESMPIKRGMLQNTEWNSDRICSLPLFPDMIVNDVDDVVEAIKEVLK